MRQLWLDTETGGLSAKENSLLTIGLYIPDQERSLELKIKHESYHVSPVALKVNNIDLEDHDRDAIPTREATLMIKDFLKNEKYIPCGHNVDFDLRFIQEQLPYVTENFHYGKICTKIIAQFLVDQKKIPKDLGTKLENLYSYLLGENLDGAHTALSDAIASYKIYQEMLKK